MSLYPWVDAATRPLMNRVYRIRHLDAERIPASGPSCWPRTTSPSSTRGSWAR